MKKKIKYLIRRFNELPFFLQNALLTMFLMVIAGIRICLENFLFGSILLATSVMCALCITFAEIYRRKTVMLYYLEGCWKGRYNVLYIINKERIKQERENSMRVFAEQYKAGERAQCKYYTNKEFIRAMKRRRKKIIKQINKTHGRK